MDILSIASSVRKPFSVLGNRDVRRLQTAFLLFATSGPAYATALLVYAYDRGGAATAGIVGLAVMLPAGLAAPLAGVLADRGRRTRVVAAASLARALCLAATALGMLFALPLALVILFAALASIPARVFFPAQIALLPRLTRSEDELVAATALGSGIENLGSVAGPAIAGAAMLVSGAGEVTALCAAFMAVAAWLAVGVREPSAVTGSSPRSGFLSELAGGWRAIGQAPVLRLVISIYTFQAAVWGILSVSIVGLALSDLHAGESGVGLLNGALGIGGVAGGLLAVAVSNRLRLGSTLRLGTLLWAAPLVLLAAAPGTAAAIALLTVIGLGNVLFDVGSYALIQRAAADDVRGRIFAVLEGAAVAGVALGSLAAGVLVEAFGVRATLSAAGLSLGLLALLTWQALERLDASPGRAVVPAVDAGSA